MKRQSQLSKMVPLSFKLLFLTGIVCACASNKVSSDNTREHSKTFDQKPYASLAKSIDNNSAPLVVEAKNIFENASVSNYEHIPMVDEKNGIYMFDCSSFVSYTLEKRSPQSLKELRSYSLVEIMKRRKHKRPLAKDYVTYFAQLNNGSVTSEHWKAVKRIKDLQPGDVLAWKTPDDLDTANTGHVMIVKSAPVQNPKNPDEFLVQIVDATSSPHGKTDSRYGKKLTGIGEGTIGLIGKADEVPVGYKWSGGESKKIRETEITFARPLVGAASLSGGKVSPK
jgi:hypothetical protein